MSSPQEWIKRFNLQKHPEGGWYKEVFRSNVSLGNDQSICTHIYFLLEQHDFSAFHRIGSDELWHFYGGDEIMIYEIDESGNRVEHLLGNNLVKGRMPFCLIKKGNWFGARVTHGEYAIVGCTVAPGFSFSQFELAKAEELSKLYPQHSRLIQSMCRG